MSQPPGLPPEGWYPNPENPEQQRWWDGRQWTEHVAVGAPMAPGYEQPQAYQPQPYQPQPYQPQPYQPQPYQPQPGAGYPGQPYAGYAGYPTAHQRGVLPDGARVVGWWWRVLARVIDAVLVSIVSSIFASSQLDVINARNDEFRTALRQAVDSNTAMPSLHDYFWQGDYLRALVWIGVAYALVAFVYEVAMLKATSATVGKLICGLRVRAWDQRGPLSWRAVLSRAAAYQLAGGVPIVGGLYTFVDRLWPLWDGRRQALHDKVAATAVVKRDGAAQAGPAR